ncbi:MULTISPECIES: hypothetical protein [Erwinia]|uniref:Uncharacterized protein n=2 Tax=Erwinia TaxID=551 RepID=A0A014M8S1_9GAMM|nr:hypothetical protein [Erwinia mallotivora]EXU74494.1 hypothetical protein BG55_16675 [Erwinia mallotivora]
MSEVVPAHQQPGRLEEAKNIALGWRIIGQITPHSLEEAIQLLRDSSAHATTVYELLSAEISEKSHRQG